MDKKRQVNSEHVTTNEDQSSEENEQGIVTEGEVCQGSPLCKDRVKPSPKESVGVSQAKSKRRGNSTHGPEVGRRKEACFILRRCSIAS